MSAHEAQEALGAQLWEQRRPAYTIGQAALVLCCSERHLWRQIAKGRIPAVRIGRRTLISRAAIEALLVPDGCAPPEDRPLARLRVMT